MNDKRKIIDNVKGIDKVSNIKQVVLMYNEGYYIRPPLSNLLFTSRQLVAEVVLQFSGFGAGAQTLLLE